MSQETSESNPAPESVHVPPAMESAQTAAENEARARIKIGTQRAGVDVPRATPKIKFVVPQKAPPEPKREFAPAAVPASPPEHAVPGGPASVPESGLQTAEPRNAPADNKFAAPATTQLYDNRAVEVIEKPNLRAELSAELQLEVAEALGDMSLDDLITGKNKSAGPSATLLEPEQKIKGKVLQRSRDTVFLDLGVTHQGHISLKNFPQPPEPGTVLDVVVSRFDQDEGLYVLSLPHGSIDVGDWSTVKDGIIVDARITGANKGGLECTVGSLRGFMPISQISLYRVEDIEQFVGQTWPSLITEANPERRNLLLSRRAVLEREKEEASEKIFTELAPGQIREGIVRNIRDFGAFVDLGGVDGLLPIGQLAWDRVKHPSDVLTLGQKVRVKIERIDPATRKISLAYRDLFESPWIHAPEKYRQGSAVAGTVTKIMDFGAFVKLEPGIEGLVHVSEITYGRVFRVADFLQEGQAVECKILTINPETQKISLSIKALMARPESVKKEKEVEEPEAPPLPPIPQSKVPLKGGLGKASGGEKFGLTW